LLHLPPFDLCDESVWMLCEPTEKVFPEDAYSSKSFIEATEVRPPTPRMFPQQLNFVPRVFLRASGPL